MPPAIVHLPNGQTLTVQPVFGGLYFKSNDLSTHHSAFPPGWTIILHSEDDEEDHLPPASTYAHTNPVAHEQDAEVGVGAGGVRPQTPPTQPGLKLTPQQQQRRHHVHRFRKPTLQNDHLFISSISNPSSSEFKPSSSPTRSIAMMLWATLWWYFHQPTPDPHLANAASAQTPEEGRPKGEWRVNINREGIFKGKHLLPKLERMGLIASEDSSVGLDPEDGVGNAGEGWTKMFVSRKSFWQLDARIYLFTLSPTQASSPYPSVSPASSRPASPNRGTNLTMSRHGSDDGTAGAVLQVGTAGIQGPPNPLSRHNNIPSGPYQSSSHLPTFYPPPPLQYNFTLTNGIRHPVRPKPPRQGETFYTRYIPSLGQYLSFRIASLSKNPCVYRGPVSTDANQDPTRTGRAGQPSQAEPSLAGVAAMRLGSTGKLEDQNPAYMTDTELMHKWMNNPRVSYSWGENGPISHQTNFLANALTSKHSFPAIGCFDGKPFGFFEIYWVKEDKLSSYLGDGRTGGGCGNWDRGIHCLVGEEDMRGRQRVRVWLSALVHFCWLSDMRTQMVFMEPRVDNWK